MGLPKNKTATMTLFTVGGETSYFAIIFNPLSPNIHIQILQTDLYTFP